MGKMSVRFATDGELEVKPTDAMLDTIVTEHEGSGEYGPQGSIHMEVTDDGLYVWAVRAYNGERLGSIFLDTFYMGEDKSRVPTFAIQLYPDHDGSDPVATVYMTSDKVLITPEPGNQFSFAGDSIEMSLL